MDALSWKIVGEYVAAMTAVTLDFLDEISKASLRYLVNQKLVKNVKEGIVRWYWLKMDCSILRVVVLMFIVEIYGGNC